MSKHRPFPYAERAREVEDARRAVREAFARVTDRFNLADPAAIEWRASASHLRSMSPLPPDFTAEVERLRSGDLAPLDGVIEFLEADPMCFGSGYHKAYVLKRLMPLPLTSAQAARLRRVVVSVTTRRDGREFRRYCQLAAKIDSPELRDDVKKLLEHADSDVRRRAGWVMQALRRSPG